MYIYHEILFGNMYLEINPFKCHVGFEKLDDYFACHFKVLNFFLRLLILITNCQFLLVKDYYTQHVRRNVSFIPSAIRLYNTTVVKYCAVTITNHLP